MYTNPEVVGFFFSSCLKELRDSAVNWNLGPTVEVGSDAGITGLERILSLRGIVPKGKAHTFIL